MTSEDKKKNKNSKNKVTKATKKVSPWAERIGVYIIALMTIFGAALITYTGVQALIHDDATELPELLIYDEIFQKSDINLDDDDEGDNATVENEVTFDEDKDDENKQESTNKTELTSFIGVITADGVNVREAPEANDSISIIVQLSEGDQIKVLNSEYNDDWMEVDYDNQIGYVNKEFVKQAE